MFRTVYDPRVELHEQLYEIEGLGSVVGTPSPTGPQHYGE